MVRITCLGGAGTVTGSCYLVESANGLKVLVDCGLFQGGKQMEIRNWSEWGFDPKEIGTLFLTHAHIDHSGRIPKLVKDGFQGEIITSPPTAELCQVMLMDSAHVQEMDAEWQNRKNRRQAKNEVFPLYNQEDAAASLRLFKPVQRDQIITLDGAMKARLRNAGHILGSSILELWVSENGETIKIAFSGDLGRKDQLIVRDPHQIFDADYLFIESTYGNRLHRSFDDSKQELLEAIQYSASRGGKILIPAFAVERTQEILYILNELYREGLLPDIPIFLDSPLAIKATEIFRRNKKYYDEEAMAIVKEGHDPFNMPLLKYTESTKDSMAINEYEGSAIIIAGSGMCTAGRIKHHLKHNLWREGASLVIVGFQAKGTTGRKLVDGAKRVRIFRENVTVRAKVYTIGGFSAHADQHDLLNWVGHFESRPHVFVVHGEPSSSEAFAQKLSQQMDLTVRIPKWRERLILKPKALGFEEPIAEASDQDIRELMQNAVIDLENELKALKKRIHYPVSEEKLGEDELDRLRYVQEELHSILSD